MSQTSHVESRLNGNTHEKRAACTCGFTGKWFSAAGTDRAESERRRHEHATGHR